MVLEVRVSIVSGFVVEGQNWTNPIVEGPKVDFFPCINYNGRSLQYRFVCSSSKISLIMLLTIDVDGVIL